MHTEETRNRVTTLIAEEHQLLKNSPSFWLSSAFAYCDEIMVSKAKKCMSL
jgi:hypothetical protein